MIQRLRSAAPVVISIAAALALALTALAAEKTVYVTRSGEKYHSASCRHLGKSRVAMPLDEAVNGGYGPCSRCQAPPKRGNSKARKDDPKAEPGRNAPKSSRCAATTEQGARCKRKAASGSSYCWQHGRSKRSTNVANRDSFRAR